MSKFQQIYVLEWLHKSSGEWTAISGDTSFRRAMRSMKESRGKYQPKDKFRTRKYVPEEKEK